MVEGNFEGVGVPKTKLFKGKYESKLEFGEVGGRGELISKNHLWWKGIFSGNTYSRHSNFSSFPKLYSNGQEFLQSCRMPWSGSWQVYSRV